MDPSHRCRPLNPCLIPNHHHHHHHHLLFLCPHHHHIYHNLHHHHHLNDYHPHLCPNFAFPTPHQNPEPVISLPLQNDWNLEPTVSGEAYDYGTPMLQEQEQEQEHAGLEVEEEDPVFVLTDEWREFFAKSEAKRKLEKKQAKKKGKN